MLLKTGIALVPVLTPVKANKADAIDVSIHSAAALRDAMTFTALLGLLLLCVALFCLLAEIRYRTLVSLIYLWLPAEFLARRVILELYPMDRVHGLTRISGQLVLSPCWRSALRSPSGHAATHRRRQIG